MKGNFDLNLEETTTSRGFHLVEFTDRSNVKCSLQKSSLATENAIWLGVNEANPQVLASKAKLVGVETNETTGWVPYPVPDEVLMITRMHLTQAQVKQLLPLLKRFAKTGELYD